MTKVHYLLNRHIRLGASYLKHFSTLTNQTWCFEPTCWKTIFSSSPPRAVMRFSVMSSEVKPRHQSIFGNESIAQYLEKDTIPWQEVKSTILATPQLGVKETNLTSSVLLACFDSNLLDVAVSYYKDVLNNGGKFSISEYSLLMKVLGKNREKVQKQYTELVRELFPILEPYITSHKILQSDCTKVFSCVKDLWDKLIKMFEKELPVGSAHLVIGAFEHNEADTGWKLLNQSPDSFGSDIVKAYLNYCIRMAKTNKFSILLINDLVRCCQDMATVIPYIEVYDSLKTLVSILNNSPDKKYQWIVEKSVVNAKGICDKCGLKLNKVTITEADFNELKSHVLNDVLINKNCYIKTSVDEVNRFISFLSKSSNYNFVIDGLNVMYRNSKAVSFQKLWDYLEEKEKKVLLIGKKHLLWHPVYKNFKRNAQVFLTDNLSDDDVFVIYAALNGGRGTEFLTGDFYRGYGQFIRNNYIRRIYIKWQLSHQRLLSNKLKVCSAPGHSYLPQITNVPSPAFEKGQLSWHLSAQPFSNPRLQAQTDFYWVCLKAVPVRGLQ